MAETEPKKKEKNTKKEKSLVKNTIDLNPTLDEAKSNTVAFTWGRFSPPTIGHEKLVNKVVSIAKQNNATPMIFTSHTQDSKKNPLSYDKKIAFLKKAFGSIPQKTNAKTIIAVLQELEKKFSNVILIVGEDRIPEFTSLLNKYNGKDFNFDSVKVVSAGARDPDAEGVEGMSASKMRAAAEKDDFVMFKSGLPTRLKSSADVVYKEVRQGMNLSEEVEDLEELVLTPAQRRKRAMTFKRSKAKIQRGREKAKQRFASPEKLKTRARKKAIEFLKKKIAGKQGENYASLNPAAKMAVDKRIEKKKGSIDTIARKLFPKVKTAERERLKKVRSNESVELDEAKVMIRKEDGEYAVYVNGKKHSSYARKLVATNVANKLKVEESYTPPKRHHMMLQKNGTVKHDMRFKRNKKWKQLKEESEVPLVLDEMYDDIINELFEDAVETAKASIKREKEADKQKHDRMMDRARLAAAKLKNRQTN